MALINCPECNKEISDTVKTCPNCGYKLPKTKRIQSPHGNRKRVAIIIGVFLALIAIGGGFFFFSPRTVEWFCCHHISDATCIEPKKCSRCGKIWGEPLGHEWQEATCTKSKTCAVCGATEGLANGHEWQAATCTEPKTCTVCGITEGSSIGHVWQIATCTKPKTCTVCGITEGYANGHEWQAATCTKPRMCIVCGKMTGESTGHVLKDYICTKCGEVIIEENDVENILDITLLRYEVNYVGGIDIYMTFSNKLSTKTINYITVEMEFYNAVGDVLKDDISKAKTASLLFTGPLNAGKKSVKTYWRACFYNSTFSGTINIKKIKIEYSDGSKITLDEDIAWYAVKAWR